ncbi:MAG: hypothetical protein RLZZ50_1050, partial [Verrucomicrobiota bacterium]
MRLKKKWLPGLVAHLALWSSCAAQSWTAPQGANATIEGNPGLSTAVLTLDTALPAALGGLRFGPIRRFGDTRFMNLRLRVDGAASEAPLARVSLLLSANDSYPENPDELLARSDHPLRGRSGGYQHINPAFPRLGSDAAPARTLWLEISAPTPVRDAPAAQGRLRISEVELLTSHLEPQASSRDRRAAYLAFAGRRALAESPA